jgi:DNA-binding MarR family transcriptional regulator
VPTGYYPHMLPIMESSDRLAALERIVVGAVALTTRSFAEAEPGLDLTFPQWRALMILGEADGGERIGAVAARVGVTLPATGRLLRRLERRGLVTLSIDETDRRATRARLTQKGTEVRAALLRYRRQALTEVAARLGAQDQDAIGQALERLAGSFEPPA